MDVWAGLGYGLQIFFHNPVMFILLFAGSFVGTLVGALPGLGAVSGVALLLPFAYTMRTPQMGLIFLCSIYLGNMFGGRITAILINVPGDAPAVVTTFDGYPMMKQGRGGLALGISAISSFVGGFISFVLLAGFAPPLARFALNFGAAEYFMVMLFGFAAVIGLEENNYIKGLVMLCFGILISNIGIDLVSGIQRYTFSIEMYDGIPFVIVCLGVFGITEVLKTAEKVQKYTRLNNVRISIRHCWPSWKDFKSCIGCILRGSFIGTSVGFLPGAGGTIATFIEYTVEKGVSKKPEEFGKGKIQGVAGPEASNNGSVGGAMIPMFALGIPGSSTAAIILGAMVMFGIQPGPRIFETSADIVWTMIAGLFMANVILLLVNILLIPIFVKIIDVGQSYLKPIICAIIIVGVFAVTYSNFFIFVCIVFGILGFFISKLSYPIAPLMLALVLWPNTEEYFRQALMVSRGDYGIFLGSPISVILFVLSLFSLLYPMIKRYVKRKRNIQKQD